MAEVRFDDIEGLNTQAGEFSDWSAPLTVTQEMINQFADLTGDHQWIHVDVDRANRESPFGGPVAHGFLTLSLIPGLAPGDQLKVVGHANAANYGAEKLRFMSPVPAGSEVHARIRLVRAEAKPRGTLVTSEVEVGVVGAERPALVYAMQALYMGPA
ncbi:MAG TPA: MaoC family dehydratase [Acidimicrobiales bacterium]|jgi:hypothetical protein|nr:MaoC family dehydratase [Acidimicrobiales bacterium]